MVQLEVQRVGDVEVDLPAYATTGAAGMDLQAALPESKTLLPGKRLLIPTGLRFAIPAGYEGQVRPRSGLALKWGVTVVNSPGTIDSDFRGEVGVVLINHGEEPLEIEPRMRIAQLVICKVERAVLVEQVELSSTLRGAGGYGSTGT